MEISYDKEADALAIWFANVEPEKTIDITEDIFVDIDVNGRLAGIEVLHASKKSNLADLLTISIKFPNFEKLFVQLPDLIGIQ